MDIEKAINKLTQELLKQRVVLPGHKNIIKKYLYMAHGVGYDQGRKIHSNQMPVIQLDRLGNELNHFPSAAQASRELKIDHTGIVNVCKGKQHTAGGYLWKYKNKTE